MFLFIFVLCLSIGVAAAAAVVMLFFFFSSLFRYSYATLFARFRSTVALGDSAEEQHQPNRIMAQSWCTTRVTIFHSNHVCMLDIRSICALLYWQMFMDSFAFFSLSSLSHSLFSLRCSGFSYSISQHGTINLSIFAWKAHQFTIMSNECYEYSVGFNRISRTDSWVSITNRIGADSPKHTLSLTLTNNTSQQSEIGHRDQHQTFSK